MNLDQHGFCVVATAIPEELLSVLRDTLVHEDRAGERCLLDHPVVQNAALFIHRQLAAAGHLRQYAAAIQAIAFDKTPATNWKVAWHRDLIEPKHRRILHLVYHTGEPVPEPWHRAIRPAS